MLPVTHSGSPFVRPTARRAVVIEDGGAFNKCGTRIVALSLWRRMFGKYCMVRADWVADVQYSSYRGKWIRMNAKATPNSISYRLDLALCVIYRPSNICKCANRFVYKTFVLPAAVVDAKCIPYRTVFPLFISPRGWLGW